MSSKLSEWEIKAWKLGETAGIILRLLSIVKKQHKALENICYNPNFDLRDYPGAKKLLKKVEKMLNEKKD